jgi:7-keto-8-aminopelargonate synthetase-like enzyme
MLNYASYDYLGLNGDARITGAAKRAIDAFGTSVSASRLVAGERPFHGELERKLAQLYGVDDAVTMVSGHATNATTIGHLLGQPDLLIHDGSIHNSVIVGGRLSHATVMKFAHNDLAALEALLIEHRGRFRRCLIVVEGLYSMEGDIADLPALIALKKKHSAWLMVDEAHALGVLGERGLGSAEHWGIAGRGVDIWMGTLSKTLASTGGYIAGAYSLIDYLKHSAPGFIFSVGLSAPNSAAASKALDCMLEEPARVTRLAKISAMMKQGLDALGVSTGTSIGRGIVPAYMGDSIQTMIWAEMLYRAGINVLPIVFPAVSYDGALLRFFLSAEHSEAQIERTLALVASTHAEVKALQTDYSALQKAVAG